MLTGSRLAELLDYSPDTGDFRWRGGHKKTVRGAVAGTNDKDGYRIICIDRKMIRAHRLAWVWMTGKWPENEIDHINGVKDDNRFCNLREATHRQNSFNRPKRGYTWDKRRCRYVAQININGRHVHLGTFDNESDARSAYLKAAADHHKEFARA